jgi:hypothetical protein
MGGCTRAVSGQRLGKHLPVAADTKAAIEELCFMCGPCRDVISKEQGQFSPVRESVKRGLEPEPGGRRIAIVEAVTRKRLVTDWEH